MPHPQPALRLAVAACLAAASTQPAAAQRAAEPSAEQPVAAVPVRRNALRLDVGGVFITNVLYEFDGYSGFLFPVMVSYERQLGQRTSAVVEGLLNGGQPDERRAGLALMGRYYLTRRPESALTGFYLAPMLSHRTLVADKKNVIARQQFGGVGVLAGWQVAPRPQSPVFIDIALGVVKWQKVGAETISYPNYPKYAGQPKPETYYEKRPVVLDGRLGVGYRF